MRCNVCLTRSAGPLGVCVDCLTLAYPNGATPWVMEHIPMVSPLPTPRTMVASNVPMG